MSEKKLPARDRLIVALDAPALAEAERVIGALKGAAPWFKVGSELFTAAGPRAVEMVKKAGAKVFLDLKFHDIPNTVASAGIAAADLGVDMFNVHAMGGARMMREAASRVAEHCQKTGKEKPLIIAVTVLTSMGRDDLHALGMDTQPGALALDLAAMAQEAGLDGVVASAEEARGIKARFGADFVTVTPGVRPSWAAADDQRRVKTPAEAVREGADYLVVGRPILKAPDPAEAAARIIGEMEEAL